ncbi:cytoskeletal protein binding protein [Cadophora gregata f. sp. sojae]|nr:cytoskeletal protein binding protein [Cadophora gregata f. sp. sojae]
MPVIYGEGKENAFRCLGSVVAEENPLTVPAASPKKGFLGIYRALYDYKSEEDGELCIQQGEILCVLEKSEGNEWWRAWKKGSSGKNTGGPSGLVPSNYIEKAVATHTARARYDNTSNSEVELAFPKEVQLEVFDISDPDWIVIGFDGEYGFAPLDYIKIAGVEEPSTFKRLRQAISHTTTEAQAAWRLAQNQ